MKSFLLNDNNISRNSFIWNMIGSFFYAFQSTVILMVMTRCVDLYESGIFTIAYANANLFLIIGHYGMRNFQVSDMTEQFSFREYHFSRIITVSVMILIGCIFVVMLARNKNYSSRKVQIMIWMLFLKAVDAYEGVFHGQYQRYNRLDVAGRCLSIRMCIFIIVYCGTLLLTKDQLVAIMISTISTIFVFAFLLLITRKPLIYSVSITKMDQTKNKEKTYTKNKMWALLSQCFPLFLGCFLSFYIGNAPKYAIDVKMSGESQARYGFIAMPVFVVELLTSFIFMPQMYLLSKAWNEKKFSDFRKMVIKQIVIICLSIIVCLVGGYFMGIPILSFIFNTDLRQYKLPLLILIIGGGFLGLNGFLNAVITIVRQQKYSMFGYAVIAMLVFVLSGKVVSQYGIVGAAGLYTISMITITIFFVLIMRFGLRKGVNSE